jgi:hypothetical protein
MRLRASLVRIRDEADRLTILFLGGFQMGAIHSLVTIWHSFNRLSSQKFSAVIFVGTLFFLTAIELFSLSYTQDGLHFERWTSDDMMQCLPIQQLRQTPLHSLWYLHKQPPMLDAIRAVLAYVVGSANEGALLRRVDAATYVVWGFFSAGIAVLVFRWLEQLTTRLYALFITAFWVASPSAITYATTLEGTLISAFGSVWLFYELWRFTRQEGSAWRLSTLCIFLILTRTVFQWYFVPLLVVALIVMRAPWRQIAGFAVLTTVVIAPFIAKQYFLFQTLSTSTFGGYHKAGIIWYQPSSSEMQAARNSLDLNYPAAANEYSGNDVYNNQKNYEDNLIYESLARGFVRSNPLESGRRLWRSIGYNFKAYWRPSHTGMSSNIIGANLPWTREYDFVFSRYGFLFLISSSLVIWLMRMTVRGWTSKDGLNTAAIGLVTGYILAVCWLCNRLEWTEAMRLKFLLEPVYFVFIAYQTRALFLALKSRRFDDTESKVLSFEARIRN